MSSTPTRPSRPAAASAEASDDENDVMPVSPSPPTSPDRDGRSLEERTFSMDYDAAYHYKDNVGKHYHGRHHRSSPNNSNSNLATLKDKITDTFPNHAPHLVPTAADHRSRYLPGVLYVPMLIARWIAHPFRLLMGTAEDSDREVHVHHGHGHTHVGGSDLFEQ